MNRSPFTLICAIASLCVSQTTLAGVARVSIDNLKFEVIDSAPAGSRVVTPPIFQTAVESITGIDGGKVDHYLPLQVIGSFGVVSHYEFNADYGNVSVDTMPSSVLVQGSALGPGTSFGARVILFSNGLGLPDGTRLEISGDVKVSVAINGPRDRSGCLPCEDAFAEVSMGTDPQQYNQFSVRNSSGPPGLQSSFAFFASIQGGWPYDQRVSMNIGASSFNDALPPVPEPSVLALFLLGAPILVVARQRLRAVI